MDIALVLGFLDGVPLQYEDAILFSVPRFDYAVYTDIQRSDWA